MEYRQFMPSDRSESVSCCPSKIFGIRRGVWVQCILFTDDWQDPRAICWLAIGETFFFFLLFFYSLENLIGRFFNFPIGALCLLQLTDLNTFCIFLCSWNSKQAMLITHFFSHLMMWCICFIWTLVLHKSPKFIFLAIRKSLQMTNLHWHGRLQTNATSKTWVWSSNYEKFASISKKTSAWSR